MNKNDFIKRDYEIQLPYRLSNGNVNTSQYRNLYTILIPSLYYTCMVIPITMVNVYSSRKITQWFENK